MPEGNDLTETGIANVLPTQPAAVGVTVYVTVDSVLFVLFRTSAIGVML